MKIATLVLCVLGVLAAPVIAQAASDTPQPATTTVGKLLAAGYELKAITDLSDAEQKTLWPKDSTSPFIMATFEKSGSLAVCIVSMSDWIDGDINAGTCRIR